MQIDQLFDFLVERALEGNTPKEIEIAHTVFNKANHVNIGLDATVRVCAHRLRKKLEEAPAGENGERLLLPRGEYRLVVTSEEKPTPQEEAPPQRSFALTPQVWLALALAILTANLASWIWYHSIHRNAVLETRFWRDLANSGNPTLLVSGDHYVFGERGSDGSLKRVIKDPSIRSRRDLDRRKMENPQLERSFVDLNLHDLPEGMMPALTTIAPLVRQAVNGEASAPDALIMSRFTTDMLSGHNVIYLGLLSDLGDLRAPLFDNSGFMLADGDKSLIDRTSRRRFESDWSDLSEDRIMRRDYAYLASLPGPSGNRILVIAGTDDPALVEAAKIAAGTTELAKLDKIIGKTPAFEALYEVRTFGPSNFAGRLLLARPFRVDRMWPESRPAQAGPGPQNPSASTPRIN